MDDCIFASVTGDFESPQVWSGWGVNLCDEGVGSSCDGTLTASYPGLLSDSYDFQIVCVPEGTTEVWWDIVPSNFSVYAITVDEGD